MSTIVRPPVRVGVVGAGYFAQFHHDAWKRIEAAELAAVVDLDLDKAAQSGAKPYSNLEQMILVEQPDILDIVTPPNTHLEFVETAITKGVRTIICQKPFCGTTERAEAAIKLAKENGTLIVVHENFRFQPWYRAVKQKLDEGWIGDVLTATFRLRPGDGQGEDAYLSRQPYFQKMPKFLVYETGVHWIDTFRFLFGEPSSVYADLRRVNPAITGEDAGLILFGYGNGLRTVFDGNRLLDFPAENKRLTMGEFIVEGTDGELRIRGDGAVLGRTFGENDFAVLENPPAEIGFGGDCVGALQAHVVAALTEGKPVENEASHYIRNMEITNAVYDSAETGKMIVLD